MGNCTEVYLLQLDALHQIIGKGQGEMLARVMGMRQRALMQGFEQRFETSAKPFLADIFNGTPLPPGSESAPYASALRILLREVAETLPNTSFCPYRLAWLETLDEVLKSQGLLDWKFTDLIDFAPPVPLPSPDDFPGVCTIPATQAANLKDAFAGLKFKSLEKDLVQALKQATTWFQKAAASGSGLVLFTS